MKQTRLKPEERKAAAVLAGIELAEQGGLSAVSLSAAAKSLGVSGAALTYHFKTAECFLAEVIEGAVRCNRLRVVAQAVVRGHGAVEALGPEERKAALAAFC